MSGMVAQSRGSTGMGLLEEARLARMRGYKVSQKAGSIHNAFGRVKCWRVGSSLVTFFKVHAVPKLLHRYR